MEVDKESDVAGFVGGDGDNKDGDADTIGDGACDKLGEGSSDSEQ